MLQLELKVIHDFVHVGFGYSCPFLVQILLDGILCPNLTPFVFLVEAIDVGHKNAIIIKRLERLGLLPRPERRSHDQTGQVGDGLRGTAISVSSLRLKAETRA